MLADSDDRESAFCSEESNTFKKGGNVHVNDSLFLTGNAYGVDNKFLWIPGQRSQFFTLINITPYPKSTDPLSIHIS